MKTIRRITRLLMYCCLCYICISCEEDDDTPANNPPKIEAQSFSVAENSPGGTTVGTVKATDQDEDELTFSITDGNTGEAFAINGTSGVITVNDPSVFDFETNPSFTLVVQVSDGTDMASANIGIEVTDQDENLSPVVENQSFSIDENSQEGTVVGTIQASDPDEDALTFSITDGNTGDAFAVNAGTGELTVNTSSALDYETTPSFTLTIAVSDGQVSSTAGITVELNDIAAEPLATRAEVLASLESRYVDFGAYLEFTYLLDGVYANTTASPSSEWDNLHAHSHNSNDGQVLKLWSEGYELILDLNNIILSAENALTDNQEKDEVTGQAMAIRAYLYFNLMKWFGPVPLELEIENTGSFRSSQQDVITFIQNNLNLSIGKLPASWTAGQEGKVTKGFAQALLARTYLFNADWSNALTLANEIIGNSLYNLSENTNNFTADNSELIWGFEQTGNAQFSSFFTKGNYVPVFRLTEAYLISAEAHTALFSLTDAKDALDVLRLRAGEATLPAGLSQSDLSGEVFSQWQSEMSLEGNSFITLRRFFKAESELSIANFQLLLPVPFEILDNNSNLTQNQGY